MRKFIFWPDGVKRLGIPPGARDELSPLTFDEFSKLDRWVGTDDLAFGQFLRHNNFREIEDDALYPYNDAALRAGIIVLEPGEPAIDWSVTYGSLHVS